MQEPRVAVILRYGLNRDAWRVRFDAGEVGDVAPYGYQLAEGAFTLDWSVDHRECTLTKWWRNAVRGALGFDLVHVWRNRRLVERADAVWTHTEREHLAVAMLKAISPRRYRARSIAQSVWLWDLWPQYSTLRKFFFRRLLMHHDVEIVLSRVNRDASRLAVPGREVIRVPFGAHLATPRRAGTPASHPPRVLAVGNDRHRDWNLLAQVAAMLPQLDFDIVSLDASVRELPWPVNAEVRGITQQEVLTTAYREADVVAIALLPNKHASGCTVGIEGVSAGLPVVASDTGGIDEYLEGSLHELIAVGDATAFADALLRQVAAESPADGHVAEQRGLSESDYVSRLVSVTESVLAERPIELAVQTFSHMPEIAGRSAS